MLDENKKQESKNTVTIDKDGKKHYRMIAEPGIIGTRGSSMGKDTPFPSEPLDPTDNSIAIVNPE